MVCFAKDSNYVNEKINDLILQSDTFQLGVYEQEMSDLIYIRYIQTVDISCISSVSVIYNSIQQFIDDVLQLMTQSIQVFDNNIPSHDIEVNLIPQIILNTFLLTYPFLLLHSVLVFRSLFIRFYSLIFFSFILLITD